MVFLFVIILRCGFLRRACSEKKCSIPNFVRFKKDLFFCHNFAIINFFGFFSYILHDSRKILCFLNQGTFVISLATGKINTAVISIEVKESLPLGTLCRLIVREFIDVLNALLEKWLPLAFGKTRVCIQILARDFLTRSGVLTRSLPLFLAI